MKKLLYPLAAALLLTVSAFTAFKAVDYKIADGYSVKFVGDHPKNDPSGEFKGLTGKISFDPANLAASSFNASIEVATINTGNGMKNTHAKSEMWFDAAKYPTISFASTSITKGDAGYIANGKLTMHGVTKDISIPFTFENNVFAGTFEINRLDYNVNVAEPDHGAAKFKVSISVPVTE